MFLDVGKPNFISCLFCCWLVFHFILLSFFKNHTAVFLPLSFYTFLLILSFSLCPFSIYFFHSLSSSCHFLTPPDFYPTSSYLLAPTPMFFLLFLWAFGSQAPLLTCIFQAWSHWPQILHWNCHTLLLRNPSVQLLVPSLVRKFASPRRNLLCFSSSYRKNPTQILQNLYSKCLTHGVSFPVSLQLCSEQALLPALHQGLTTVLREKDEGHCQLKLLDDKNIVESNNLYLVHHYFWKNVILFPDKSCSSIFFIFVFLLFVWLVG